MFSSGTKLLYADFAPNRNPFKLIAFFYFPYKGLNIVRHPALLYLKPIFIRNKERIRRSFLTAVHGQPAGTRIYKNPIILLHKPLYVCMPKNIYAFLQSAAAFLKFPAAGKMCPDVLQKLFMCQRFPPCT